MKKALLLLSMFASLPAYAVWDVTTPAGTEAKSLGDNRIREFKSDVQTALQSMGDFPGPDTTNPHFIVTIPTGTTSQRPSGSTDTVAGMWFVNVSSNCIEMYDGASWSCVAAVPNYSITNVQIATDTVTGANIATDTVTADEIAANAVGASELADDAVDPNAMSNGDYGAFTFSGHSAALDTNTVGPTELQADSVGSSEIQTDAVGAAEIAADAVGSSEIATDAVGASEIAADAVGTSEIADGSIGTADLSSAVTDLFSPKSVQRSTGTVTFTNENGQKTTNVTITSVSTSKSYVILNGTKWTDDGTTGAFTVSCSAQLTSATNVRVVCSLQGANTSGGVDVDVQFTVVEWN